MRERERLEDFRGGHVACRGCKRLLFFAPDELAQPKRCCGFVYAPTRHQIDLVIYDRLMPGEFAEAEGEPAPAPMAITDESPEKGLVPDPPPWEQAEVSDVELDDLVATPAQIAEREIERQISLARRGPGRPAIKTPTHG